MAHCRYSWSGMATSADRLHAVNIKNKWVEPEDIKELRVCENQIKNNEGKWINKHHHKLNTNSKWLTCPNCLKANKQSDDKQHDESTPSRISVKRKLSKPHTTTKRRVYSTDVCAEQGRLSVVSPPTLSHNTMCRTQCYPRCYHAIWRHWRHGR